jgi:hypothetical protein
MAAENGLRPGIRRATFAPMTRRIFGTALAVLLGLITTGLVAQTERPFTQQLSAEDYAAAGLGKLTAAERATLDRLVAQGPPRPPAPVAAAPMAVRPTPSADSASVPDQARVRRSSEATSPRVISSRLVGTFRGWTGSTVFELENGQRWVQVGGESYNAYPPRENPVVEVRPAMMGTYLLKIDGYNARCRVKLLED